MMKSPWITECFMVPSVLSSSSSLKAAKCIISVGHQVRWRQDDDVEPKGKQPSQKEMCQEKKAVGGYIIFQAGSAARTHLQRESVFYPSTEI